MGIFSKLALQNGTEFDDFMFGDPFAGIHTTINGNGGNDVIFGDFTFFELSTPGLAIDTALSIDFANAWSVVDNPDIEASRTVPHMTIMSESIPAGRQAFWSVTAAAGATITLDVDYGFGEPGNQTDVALQLIGPNRTTVLASNDTSTDGVGGLDASVPQDPFISFTVATAGTYYIRAFEPGGDGNFEAGDDYLLHVSVTGHIIGTSAPAGNDILNGGAGSDVLYGFNGNDILDGGDDAVPDVLRGGNGNDTYVFRSFDRYFEDGFSTGGGIDTMNASISATLPRNIDVLRLLGTANINGIGNDAPETIVGNSGVNFLRGNGGSDTINGGANIDVLVGGVGRDTLTGGSASDRFDYNTISDSRAGGEFDTITDFVSGTDKIDLSDIDANVLIAGNQQFRFIGSTDFGTRSAIDAGQVNVFTPVTGIFIVSADIHGDGIADFSIVVNSVSAAIVGTDFIL